MNINFKKLISKLFKDRLTTAITGTVILFLFAIGTLGVGWKGSLVQLPAIISIPLGLYASTLIIEYTCKQAYKLAMNYNIPKVSILARMNKPLFNKITKLTLLITIAPITFQFFGVKLMSTLAKIVTLLIIARMINLIKKWKWWTWKLYT